MCQKDGTLLSTCPVFIEIERKKTYIFPNFIFYGEILSFCYNLSVKRVKETKQLSSNLSNSTFSFFHFDFTCFATASFINMRLK
jgi:hypothetical protein